LDKLYVLEVGEDELTFELCELALEVGGAWDVLGGRDGQPGVLAFLVFGFFEFFGLLAYAEGLVDCVFYEGAYI
jgi:hypothetical protein